MAEATAMKRAASEVLTDSVRARTTPKQNTKTVEQTDIASNPFYQLVFSEELTPEQKRAELAKALTYVGTKAENRERVKQWNALQEYLSNVREEMATEIIKMTDSEVFSELQAVYGQLNNDLNDFDNSMKPLTDILDALYTLRTNGETFNALTEIAAEREKAAKLNKELGELNQEYAKKSGEVRSIGDQIRDLNTDIEIQSRKKGWLGKLKPDAQAAIDQNTRQIAQLQARLEETRQSAEELVSKKTALETERDSHAQEVGKFAAEKAKLRELLDITSQEHQGRQKNLVNNALKFVGTAKERVGSVRDHLGKMSKQIENLFDANNSMLTVHALMSEGINDAVKENQEIRKGLEPTAEEDALAKVQREQKKQDLEMHIAALDDSARDTMTAFADLSSGSIRIKTMKDANDSQSSKTRTLHTQGIAGVADRLSTVLQAVSAAALGESSSMAKDTLTRMADNTNIVAQKEVIRVATGLDEVNDDLSKALDDLGAYGDVLRSSTEIRHKSLDEMRGKLDELKSMANQTRDAVNEAIAVNADVDANLKAPEAKKEEKKVSSGNPFGNFAR